MSIAQYGEYNTLDDFYYIWTVLFQVSSKSLSCIYSFTLVVELSLFILL